MIAKRIHLNIRMRGSATASLLELTILRSALLQSAGPRCQGLSIKRA